MKIHHCSIERRNGIIVGRRCFPSVEDDGGKGAMNCRHWVMLNRLACRLLHWQFYQNWAPFSPVAGHKAAMMCPSYTSHCCGSCGLYKEMTAQNNKVHCYCVSHFFLTHLPTKFSSLDFNGQRVTLLTLGKCFGLKSAYYTNLRDHRWERTFL